MDVLWVHVGQCGVSLGEAFWGTATLPDGRRLASLFRDGVLPAVLVDSEHKVIRAVRAAEARAGSHRPKGSKTHGESQAQHRYRPENCVTDRAGRGSNWALGYHGPKGGADGAREGSLIARAVAAIRAEAERMPLLSGVVVTHSLAGGTGSGVGTRLIRTLRDRLGKLFVLAVSVAPFSAGESPLQVYNSLLALEQLQDHADVVFMAHNDRLLAQCQEQARLASGKTASNSAEPAVSMGDLNAQAAQTLACALTPTSGEVLRAKPAARGGRPPPSFLRLWDVCNSLAPCPSWKLCQAVSVRAPLSTQNAATGFARSLVKTACRLLCKGTQGETAVAVQLTARHVGATLDRLAALELIEKTLRCPGWNPFPVDLRIGEGGGSKKHRPRAPCLSLAANSTSVVPFLERLLERGETMCEAGAYLHWYAKYGCDADDIRTACESVRRIRDGYVALYDG